MPHSLKAAATTTIAVVFSLLSASNAPAQSAVTFTGSSSSSFGPPQIDLSLDPEATFSIDSPVVGSTRFTLGRPGANSQPNQLTFTQAVFVAAENTLFSVGNLSFFNGQTFDKTNVSGVPLNIELALDSVAESPYQFQYQVDFELTLNNTDNSDSDADTVIIEDRTERRLFSFDQNMYELSLLGFSRDRGETFERSLQVFEDQIVSSTLFAQIKLADINDNIQQPTDIPEPAPLSAYLVLGSALLIERRLQ